MNRFVPPSTDTGGEHKATPLHQTFREVRFALSGPTLLPDGKILEATITVEQGVIAQVVLGLDPAADLAVEGTIVPGFIDLQVNGGYGADFTSDGRTVADVAAKLPATGVTAFLPTIITSPPEAYPGLLRAVCKVARMGSVGAVPCACPSGAHVLGVHLEGPYLSPRRPGAHNPALLRPIDMDEIIRWADPSIVRIVTLAPELPGALDAVRALRSRGIVVSVGHSTATFGEAMTGFAAGIGWGTHLFNAMSPLEHREPGLPGALLASAVPCGLIADGVHVHPAVVKLVYRAKGHDGLTLVTDAMAATGMSPGIYRLAGQDVIVDTLSVRLANGILAGSILTMDQAVRNVIAFTGCSLAEAVTMASTTPARVLGLARKGRIAPGCDADLVVLDRNLRVVRAFVAGKTPNRR